MIRILQIFTIMDRGGAESMIMNYYRKINRNIIQFDFLVHRDQKGAFDDEIKELGGQIFILKSINPFFPNKYYKELRLFFKKNNYSIVHSHLNTFSYFPLKIASDNGIKCRIAHAHIAIDKVNIFSIIKNKESIKEILKKLIKHQLKKRINQHSTHYFSCGKKAGNWLFGGSNFVTINNAIDTKKFIHNKDVSDLYKSKFNISNDLVIGHIGRFTSQKNHTFLLKIFACVLKKNNNSKLVLIGDGPLKKKIILEAEKLSISENILFLGVRKDIPQLCQMLDMFVFPSFYEGLPVTLIEAQAASLKILASDTITKEVKLTENIEFLSINESPDFWGNKILSDRNRKKTNQLKNILKGNYDIAYNSKELQKFYIENFD